MSRPWKTRTQLAIEYPFQHRISEYTVHLKAIKRTVPRPEEVDYGASWGSGETDRVFGFKTQKELDKFKKDWNLQ